MNESKFSRRDFSMLSAAALGGLLVGCETTPAGTTADASSELLKEPHVCRGLNTCKGNGSCKTADNACKGKNACAGRGACATAEKHDCAGHNTCHGQGGCGAHPGENSCKGKGKCAVPLSDKAWKNARANFEKAYEAKHGKKPGPAPAKS